MLKRTLGIVTALLIVGSPMAYAQSTSSAGNVRDNARLSPTEFKILSDTRVAMVKIALQLTPEQEHYWQPVADAIRARSEARYRRLSTAEERMGQWRDADPLQLYRERADALTERATGLRRLADAWQPLYQSLTSEQKTRLRVVTMRTLEGIGSAVQSRRIDMYDEDDSEF